MSHINIPENNFKTGEKKITFELLQKIHMQCTSYTKNNGSLPVEEQRETFNPIFGLVS